MTTVLLAVAITARSSDCARLISEQQTGIAPKAKSLNNLARYLLLRRGRLCGSGVDVLAHLRTCTDLPAADLQLLLMAVLWLDQGLGKPTQHGFTVGAAALKSKSRGAITLRSNNPLEPPVIQPDYCGDEEGEDMRVLLGTPSIHTPTRYHHLTGIKMFWLIGKKVSLAPVIKL